MSAHKYIADVAAEVEIPKDGIISRVIQKDAAVNVTVFGFDAGQELSEHTASVPAIIQILKGEADLTLGEDKLSAGPGAWAYMEANLPHSVLARTPVVMLLTMIKAATG